MTSNPHTSGSYQEPFCLISMNLMQWLPPVHDIRIAW